MKFLGVYNIVAALSLAGICFYCTESEGQPDSDAGYYGYDAYGPGYGGELLPPAGYVVDYPPVIADNGYWAGQWWNRQPDYGYGGWSPGYSPGYGAGYPDVYGRYGDDGQGRGYSGPGYSGQGYGYYGPGYGPAYAGPGFEVGVGIGGPGVGFRGGDRYRDQRFRHRQDFHGRDRDHRDDRYRGDGPDTGHH
jgi:hypothetical protein